MVAIDFETYYDKKTYSIKDLGAEAYVADPRFQITMVAVVGEGIRFVGEAADFDWMQLHDKDLCAHNARFDQVVFEEGGQRVGVIPAACRPRSWSCTADLTAYLGCSRSLGKASTILLRRSRDKTIRDQLSGIQGLKEARAQGLEQLFLDYCLQDAIDCLDLWEQYHTQWPKLQQKVSRYNRNEGRRGVRVNVPLLKEFIEVLTVKLWELGNLIPWDWSGNKTPTSTTKMAQHCRSLGLPVPSCTERDDPEMVAWIAAHGAQHPWMEAMLDWRRTNTLLGKLQAIRTRLRPDGTMPVELMYFGGHTGRFSGAGGVNMQNLPRGELQGVDLRRLFIPREGHKFFQADLSQIEPRVLAVLTRNQEFLAHCENSSPYEAHARATMGWTGGKLSAENPGLYSLAKARVLALGYGAGWAKFIGMAANYIRDPQTFADIFEAPTTGDQRMEFYQYLVKYAPEEARQFEIDSDRDKRVKVNSWLQVTDFRDSNPKIVNMWRQLDEAIKACHQGNYEVELPNGRVKTYYNVRRESGGVTAMTVRGGTRTHLYGGKICENITQAVAFDVFSEGYVRLLETHPDIHIPFHVHDENVVEAPEDTDPEIIRAAMTVRPEWLPSCPIAADVATLDYYSK